MSQENVKKLLEVYELLNTRFVALKRVASSWSFRQPPSISFAAA